DAVRPFGDADFAWVGVLVGWPAQLGGAVGLILCVLVGIAVLALGWWTQRKPVDGHWAPVPWRDIPAGAAEAAGDPSATSDGTSSQSVSSGLTVASEKYPKIAPPQGAPTPPAPQY